MPATRVWTAPVGAAAIHQHRVLFWGVLGAFAMRGAMIAVGAVLVAEFHWILYLFAAFLIFTAVRMLFFEPDDVDIEHNVVVRVARRWLPVTDRFHGERFFVRAGDPSLAAAGDAVLARAAAGTLLLTPLALALVMVEATDLVFAVDSIPAIFAITADPFLVFTSNVFAILGLRSLYFALADLIDKFRYLKTALSLVLLVVGLKMLFAGWLKAIVGSHFNLYLLLVIVAILAGGVVASLVADRRAARREG
jgi:tellurite resistance protein TerC